MLCAVILAGSGIVRLGREGAKASSGSERATVQDTFYGPDARLMMRFKRSAEAIQHEREANADAAAAVLALTLCVFGTAIWGYGDLIGALY